MSTEQPCRRYSGVTWHAKKWLVKFRFKGRVLNIGHYEDRELAAWVADFARYVCYGLNPAMWHPRVGRPNFPPRTGFDFPRERILSKLWLLGGLGLETLLARWKEYKAVVEQNAAPCAYG